MTTSTTHTTPTTAAHRTDSAGHTCPNLKELLHVESDDAIAANDAAMLLDQQLESILARVLEAAPNDAGATERWQRCLNELTALGQGPEMELAYDEVAESLTADPSDSTRKLPHRHVQASMATLADALFRAIVGPDRGRHPVLASARAVLKRLWLLNDHVARQYPATSAEIDCRCPQPGSF